MKNSKKCLHSLLHLFKKKKVKLWLKSTNWMTKQGGNWSERPPRGQWQLWKSYRPLWQRLVNVTTISQALHKFGLCSRVARRKPLLKKAHLESCLRYAKKHSRDSEAMWQKVLWADETKMELLAKMQNATFGANPTQHITQRTPSLLWSMVEAASCYGDVSHQQGLVHLSG